MKIFIKLIIAAFIFVNLSCSTTSLKTIYPTLSDGKYDSEFPYRSSSEQLQQICNTIQRVNSIAFYTSYIFSPAQHIKKSKLTDKIIHNESVKKITFQRTGSGTATVISKDNGFVALLTDAHIVSFPDTIFSYYADSLAKNTDYLESISLKEVQNNYIAGFPDGSNINILAIDPEKDLAILGNKFDQSFSNNLQVFGYPNGHAKELEWGTFVYIFGYPYNTKMVSDAIVSSPNCDKSGSFYINAVVNRGFSGGMVLAIRDGVPHFELVGLIQSIPEETNYFLSPQNSNYSYNPFVPYKGEAYVQEQTNYIYGISKIIPVETIIDFVKDNKRSLEESGYYINRFF
jgi:Trypsin-like peptidase domain